MIEQCCISHRKLHQPFKLRPGKPCEISSADPIAVAGTETTRLEKKLFNILELFHDTVPRLSSLIIGFEVLSGVTVQQARTLVDAMNEKIVGVIVTQK